jgi:hypothetical protein
MVVLCTSIHLFQEYAQTVMGCVIGELGVRSLEGYPTYPQELDGSAFASIHLFQEYAQTVMAVLSVSWECGVLGEPLPIRRNLTILHVPQITYFRSMYKQLWLCYR